MTAPTCAVVTSAINGHVYGVVIIDKKYPTCYDVLEGVEEWLQTVMRAKDIRWKQGHYGRDSSRVYATLGGAAPYEAAFDITTCENNVLLKDVASTSV